MSAGTNVEMPESTLLMELNRISISTTKRSTQVRILKAKLILIIFLRENILDPQGSLTIQVTKYYSLLELMIVWYQNPTS